MTRVSAPRGARWTPRLLQSSAARTKPRGARLPLPAAPGRARRAEKGARWRRSPWRRPPPPAARERQEPGAGRGQGGSGHGAQGGPGVPAQGKGRAWQGAPWSTEERGFASALPGEGEGASRPAPGPAMNCPASELGARH